MNASKDNNDGNTRSSWQKKKKKRGHMRSKWIRIVGKRKKRRENGQEDENEKQRQHELN